MADDAVRPLHAAAVSRGSMKAPAAGADPFAEKVVIAHQARLDLLGATFRFDCTSRALLDLVNHAYQRLPAHRFPGKAPSARVRLVGTEDGESAPRWPEPPELRTLAANGLVTGTMDAVNFAVLSPAAHAGLIAISRRMLGFGYHARYELVEFAVFTLAARIQRLIPLHAACVGAHGRAVLLVGDSGAGKSTLALHSLLNGLDFTSEDSSFVCPTRLLATGVANFVHVRPEALGLVADAKARERIRRAPVIRRRSGIDKYEIDVRSGRYRLAPSPPRVVGVVFLSAQEARAGVVLRPLRAAVALARFRKCQSFAAGQPGWEAFIRRLSRVPFAELRRGRDLDASVTALRRLVEA